MSKPVLIFAPGAWYPPTVFDPLISKLDDYECHTVAFPSIQQPASVQDLQLDIAAVRALVETAAEAGKDVFVVSHSWSGLPVNSALDGLAKYERELSGKKGGVVRLIFIAAFIPAFGESLIGAFGGSPPPWYVRDEANETVMPSDPHPLFFHDVPDGAEWAKTLRPHAWVTKNSPATGAAYLELPASYLLCEDDQAIPLPVQQVMVDRAQRKGAQIKTQKIKAAHSPWLSRADEVAEFLRRQTAEDE
ncbi:alpha/beta-hydrolase [Penicillium argentinense]|uniref:Alpha/beta-hydrolase n=1 Tax=Penicillium argentinense TaxID=1131581 RepID=A0A9W9K308_9EURO|nr:alpha/beta-hydrolase [Penicillium argentinense]KAJ5090796.1 alpha/beta-hydrolase [Penicillium argentinense]